MTLENRKAYKLVGFFNLMKNVPDFVHLVFKKEDEDTYYFQEIDKKRLIINNFIPIIDCKNRIKLFCNISTKEYKDKKFFNTSKAMFGFQVEGDFVQVGYYDELVKFFEDFDTEDEILKEEIVRFLSLSKK